MPRRHIVPTLVALNVVLGVASAVAVNVMTAGQERLLAGAVGVGITTTLLVGTAVVLHRLQTPDLIKAVMRAHINRYCSAEWTARAIDLDVEDGTGVARGLRKELLNWVLTKRGRVLVLVGEFGSGKTWALRWLASDLSQRTLRRRRSVPVPLIVNLASLGDRNPADRAELLRLATPNMLSEDVLRESADQVVLLLDGLDEILGIPDARQERISSLLQSIINLEPATTRFVIACRRHVAEATGLRDRLRRIIDVDSLDPTKTAVAQALGDISPDVDLLCIADVQASKANAYLSESGVAQLWRAINTPQDYTDLTRVPFTIFLLEEALPVISLNGAAPTLPALYRTAVEVWLARKNPKEADFEPHNRRLEELAAADFVNPTPRTTQIDQQLIDAGLLERTSDGMRFRHYSLQEYFLARRLRRDMDSYSAALLKRMNLIFMYNVNRYLIPMLLSVTPTEAGTPRRVTQADFYKFITTTGWRREGYGIWPDFEAPGGIHPGMFDSSLGTINLRADVGDALRASHEPVTGISWYDAFQFSRHNGGRLPTADEIRDHLTGDPAAHAAWSSSWYDEGSSWIAVVIPPSSTTDNNSATAKVGINPDLRLSGLGFWTIDL